MKASRVKIEKKDIDLAWSAMQNFRKMVPQLTSFARIITGNKNVVVQASNDQIATKGNVILIRPPIGLGYNHPHSRSDCGNRAADGKQICRACRVREVIDYHVYHEISHISFGTNETPSLLDRSLARAHAREWHPEGVCNHAQEIERLIDEAPSCMNLAHALNPYLPMMLNGLEDVRVNSATFSVRPGLRKIFMMNFDQLTTQGVEVGEGKYSTWDAAPPDIQFIAGLMILAMGLSAEGRLHPEVVDALDNSKLAEICDRVNNSNNVHDIFEVALDAFSLAQEIGFCVVPKCSPPPPSLGNPGGEGSDEKSGDGEASQDGPGGASPEDSPGGTDDGPGGGGTSSTSDGGGVSESSTGNSGSEKHENADGSGPGQSGSDHPEDGPTESAAPADSGTSNEERDDVSEDDGRGAGDGDRGDCESDIPADETKEDGGGGSDSEDEGDESPGNSDPEPGRPDSGPGDEAHHDQDESDGVPDEPGSTDGSGDERPDTGRGDRGSSDTEDDDLDSGATDGAEPQDQGDVSGAEGDRSERDSLQEAEDGEKTVYERDGQTDSSENPWDIEAPDEPGDAPGMASEAPPGDASAPSLSDLGECTPDDIARALSKILSHGIGDHSSIFKEMLGEDADEVDEILNIEDEHSALSPSLKKAVVAAVAQADHFDQPSVHVVGVQILPYPTGCVSWTTTKKPERFTPPETLLGKVVLHARRTFENNRNAIKQVNLKSGTINSKVLGRRAALGDPRLFGKTRIPGKRDYHVVMGVDCSGSMEGFGRMDKVKRAVFAQCEMMERVGVSFEVWGHSGYDRSITPDGHWGTSYPDQWYLYMLPVKLPNEPWNSKTRGRLANLSPIAANLDGHTLEFYRKAAQKSTATDRIIMYYSDGSMPLENYAEELDILKREVATCARLNIKLIGGGINTDAPSHHGMETTRIDSDEDVMKVLRHLERQLTK